MPGWGTGDSHHCLGAAADTEWILGQGTRDADASQVLGAFFVLFFFSY